MHNALKKLMLSTVLPLFLISCTYDPPNSQHMDGWKHMMGYDFYGGGTMWVLWIIIAVVVVFFLIGPNKKSDSFSDQQQESAMDILKKRYAKGEISLEEFEERKKHLED